MGKKSGAKLSLKIDLTVYSIKVPLEAGRPFIQPIRSTDKWHCAGKQDR